LYATVFDDTTGHPVTSTIAAISQQLRDIADLGLWTLGAVETDANLTALAQLRHQISELELRHAHHADRLSLGAAAGAADTAAWWANTTHQTKRDTKRRAALAAMLDLDHAPVRDAMAAGRGRRFHEKHQRIALHVRDKHCTALGCEWPAALCHVHHNTPWSRGGKTSVNDGRLLCPRHHSYAHSPKYEMKTVKNGRVVFSRT